MAGLYDASPALMPTYDDPASAGGTPNIAVPGTLADKIKQFVQNGGLYGGYQSGQPPVDPRMASPDASAAQPAPAPQPAPVQPPEPHPDPELAQVGLPAPQGPLPTPPIPPAGGPPPAGPDAPSPMSVWSSQPGTNATPSGAPSGPPQPPVSVPGGTPAAPPPEAAVAPPEAPQTADGNPGLPDGLSNNRRNNPLNLRFAGQDGAVNDNGFASFKSPQEGLAAASNQFNRYAQRGINTLTGLVSTWAPPNENDTASYIQTVSKATGIAPDAKIDLSDPAIQQKIMPAMSLVENGPPRGGVGGGGAGGTQVAGVPQVDPAIILQANASDEGPMASPGAAQGNNPSLGGLPYPNVGNISTSDKLLAMAAGLMGKKSLGEGLSAGLTNLTNVNQQQRQAQIAANASSLNNTYKLGMLGNAQTKTGLQAGKPVGYVMSGDQAYAKMADGSYQSLPGLTPQMVQALNSTARVGIAGTNAQTAQGRLAVAQQNAGTAATRADPNHAGDVTMASGLGKAASADVTNLSNTVYQDQKYLQEAKETDALIQQHPELMGSTLKAQGTRALTQLGFMGDPNKLDEIQKMTSDQRMAYLKSNIPSNASPVPRSNQEFQSISQAVAGLGTNPAAARYITDLANRDTQSRMAWRDHLNELQASDDPTDKKSVTGSNYMNTKRQFFQGYFKDNPLPDLDGDTATQGASPGASGGPSTPSQVLRYDAQGNLIK